MKNFLYNFISFLLFVVLLSVWQFVASTSNRITFFFASPSLVWKSVVENTINGTLPTGFLITGFEALIGFVVGVVLGTLIGFLLWYSPFIARISKPYLVIIGAIPIFAFAPIIILWFGIGITMKIALATFGTFLISLTQSYEGASSVDLEEFRLLKTFGASRFQILKKIIFPSSLDWVLTSMKINVGFALLGAFIGEFISADKGLGYFMLRSGSLYDVPSVFAGGLFLVILALLLNYIVSLIEKNKIKIIGLFSVDGGLRKLL